MRRAFRRRLLGVLGATSGELLVATAGAAPSAIVRGSGGRRERDARHQLGDGRRLDSRRREHSRAGRQLRPSSPPTRGSSCEFDLDRNATTGVAGDELVIRFWDDGLFEVLRWDGIRLSPSSDGRDDRELRFGHVPLQRRPRGARQCDVVRPDRPLGPKPAVGHRARDGNRLRAADGPKRLRILRACVVSRIR